MNKLLFFLILTMPIVSKGDSEYQDFKKFDGLHKKARKSPSLIQKSIAAGKSMGKLKEMSKNSEHLKEIQQDCELRNDCEAALEFKRAFYRFIETQDEFIDELKNTQETKESAECCVAMVKKYRPHSIIQECSLDEKKQEKYEHISEYDSYDRFQKEFKIVFVEMTQNNPIAQLHNNLNVLNCENECDNSPEFQQMFSQFIDVLEKREQRKHISQAYEDYQQDMIKHYMCKAKSDLEAFKKQEKEFYALFAQESESYEDYQKFEQIRKEFIEKEKYIKSLYGDMMFYKKDHPQWTFNVSMSGGDSDIRWNARTNF